LTSNVVQETWQLIGTGHDFVSPLIADAREFFTPLFSNWTPANWIAFGTAICSLLLGYYNNRSAASRERLKNRREEFHRRVAMPIEQALDQFVSVIDDLHDLLGTELTLDFSLADPIERRARIAQRRLSRALRFAADSRLCSADGWDIGGEEYDEFVLRIDEARRSPTDDQRKGAIQSAVNALERHDILMRDKIRRELAHYT
jgi:hypothetical protein